MEPLPLLAKPVSSDARAVEGAAAADGNNICELSRTSEVLRNEAELCRFGSAQPQMGKFRTDVPISQTPCHELPNGRTGIPRNR